jgi:hypothetical protein
LGPRVISNALLELARVFKRCSITRLVPLSFAQKKNGRLGSASFCNHG